MWHGPGNDEGQGSGGSGGGAGGWGRGLRAGGGVGCVGPPLLPSPRTFQTFSSAFPWRFPSGKGGHTNQGGRTTGVKPGGSLTGGMSGPLSTGIYGPSREIRNVWDQAVACMQIVGERSRMAHLLDAYGGKATPGARAPVLPSQWQQPPGGARGMGYQGHNGNNYRSPRNERTNRLAKEGRL